MSTNFLGNSSFLELIEVASEQVVLLLVSRRWIYRFTDDAEFTVSVLETLMVVRLDAGNSKSDNEDTHLRISVNQYRPKHLLHNVYRGQYESY